MSTTKGTIYCYRPSPAVYSISITGSSCELQCGHCSGRYLSDMKTAKTPAGLLEGFESAKKAGARCVLVSGGFTREGKLPIGGFVDALREGRRRTGMRIEIHSGILNEGELKELGEAGVDALLLDVIGDQETITDYMGGSWKVEDYRRILKETKALLPNVTISPHILIGVSNGMIKGEFNAIDMVAEGKVDSLIICTLMDEYGTPSMEEIQKVMRYARKAISVHLTLGCMRSRGKERLSVEKLAVNLGFDGIANPTREVMDYARSIGMQVVEVEECCAFLP